MGGQVEPRVFKSHQPAGQMGGQVEPRVFTSHQPASGLRLDIRSAAGAGRMDGGQIPGLRLDIQSPVSAGRRAGSDTQVCDWISDHPLALVGGRGSDAQVCGWISGELFSSSPARKLASHGRLAAVWALFARFGRWLGDLRSDVGCSFIWPTRELIDHSARNVDYSFKTLPT